MIITNREEVIDKAFGVFVRMNYEKASIITLAKACGVTKTGIVYYFPHKLDLFMAVADKYVLKCTNGKQVCHSCRYVGRVHRAIRGRGSRFHEKDC